MSYRVYGALIASLGVAAFALSASEAFARSGGAAHGAVAAPHAMARPPGAPFFRPNRRNVGTFWPGTAGFFYAPPSGGEAAPQIPQSVSGDFRYTYTYDVPWDWAHRYPPAVTPSDRPYVPSCPSETVTVPGRGGGEHTVNVMRCY